MIREVLKRSGGPARVRGWISSLRKMKDFVFADVNDGSSPRGLNVLMPREMARSLGTGACIDVSGDLKSSPKQEQASELEAKSVTVLGSAQGFPLQKKFHTKEFLREIPQFRWKTRGGSSILRYRSWVQGQLHSFFAAHDTFHVTTPVLTSSDCEGAGETFSIAGSPDFFGKKAHLTVSSQLHLEIYAAALSRVWTATPAFRAERSDTNRHLSEFWMIEAELAFVNLNEIMDFCEKMVRACVPKANAAEDLLAAKRTPEDRQVLQTRWSVLAGDWKRMTYDEARDILNEDGRAGIVELDGLSTEQEKRLVALLNSPVFVTHYPAQIKPWYMKKASKDRVECFDLLIPEIGELVGGSVREDDFEVLMSRLAELKMDANALKWYTDLRKYGSFPHAGFGMGLERLIMYVTGTVNIRETVGFIRTAGSMSC